MTNKMFRQFESPEDVSSTIDSIIAGRFQGVLIDGPQRYSEFKKPGFLSNVMQNGTKVSRFSHPEHRIALKSFAHEADAFSRQAFDRSRLEVLFSLGMVVEGGPGEIRMQNFRKHLQDERQANPTAYAIGLKELRTELLAAADADRKDLLGSLFDQIETSNVHVDEASLRNIVQQDDVYILDAIERMQHEPHLAYLIVESPEAEVVHGM